MNYKILLVTILLGSICTSAFSQQWQIAKTISGPNNDYVSGIAADDAGNFYVVGEFQSALHLDTVTLTGSSNWNVYLAKYSPSGGILWAKAIAQTTDITSDVFSRALVIDKTGSILITGNIIGSVAFSDSVHKSIGASDIYLAKFTAGGALEWIRTAGGSGTNNFNQNIANALSIDSSNNYYISGRYVSMAMFDTVTISTPLLNEFFIAKYNSDGNIVWAKSAGGDGIHTGLGLCSAADGTTYACGQFFGHVTMDEFTLDGGDAEQKMFVIKFAPDGKTLWAKKVGTGGYYGSAKDIAVDNSGNTYLAGFYRAGISIGGNDFSYNNNYKYATIVASYDPSGSVNWAISTGGSDQGGSGNNIALDTASNLILLGSFSGTTTLGNSTLTRPSGSSTFVAKLNKLGSPLWAKAIEGNGASSGTALSLKQGSIYIAGEYQDTITIGSVVLITGGLQDVYAAKIAEFSEAVDEHKPQQQPIMIYPNPTTTIIHTLSKSNNVVTDILGREVISCTDCDNLSVQSLPPGPYRLNGVLFIKY